MSNLAHIFLTIYIFGMGLFCGYMISDIFNRARIRKELKLVLKLQEEGEVLLANLRMEVLVREALKKS